MSEEWPGQAVSSDEEAWPGQAVSTTGPAKPSYPDQGLLHAAGHGALAGATFNFGDELAGVRAAAPKVAGYNIPDFLGPIPARTMAGAARLATNYFTGSDPEANSAYEKARDEERQAQESAKANHPYVYGAGELAGAVPGVAMMPEMGLFKGAGIAADIGRGALAGAEYGGLSGLGEGRDAGERVENTASGILGGGIGGAAGAGVGRAVGAVYDKFGRPIVQSVKGWANPEGEAARRVALALQKDEELIAKGTAKGMSRAEWEAAKEAGEPVTLADLGSGNVQALLRSSANTSPEGRATLEKVIQDRFLGQGERVANDVRNLVAGGANASKSADQLVAEYDISRGPLYKQAFSKPEAQGMWTPELEQLTQAPVVQNAIRMANITAKNEAAKIGFTPMKKSPFSFDENGRMVLNQSPDGSVVKPSLQYWDTVKKNLDKMGADGQAWSKTLRDHLDEAVPEYSKARGFAAQFFGERDALDAGRKLAGKRVDPEVIRDAMRKMSPSERDLFREGYASDWSNRVIGNVSDTRDITKAIFNSPNERARAEAVFGPAGMDKIQTRMTLETIMDGARQAMGNSTTARQLIEAGLAGGAIEGYLSGWDPTHMSLGAASAAGARKALGSEMAAGARKMIGKVDATTAKNVAKFLTSNDPEELAQGIRMATKNKKITDGLRRIANAVSIARIAPAGREAVSNIAPTLQGAVGVRADDKKNQPYGIGH